MDLTNMFLQSLLEAEGGNRSNANRANRRGNQRNRDDNPADDDFDLGGTDEDTDEGTDNQDESDAEGTDKETGEDNDTEQGTEDEGENQDEQDDSEENQDDEGEGENDEGEGSEDDFSLGGEEEGEGGDDNEPPPDGLTDPDDDGSGDDSSTEDEGETNIHTNVLQLSKLDRLLAKRRCLNDFYDLRTSIDTFRAVIDKNEAIINPEVRDVAVRDLNKLYTVVGDYLQYRFGYTNYEENLQNYFIFIRELNAIVKNVNENGMKKSNKT